MAINKHAQISLRGCAGWSAPLLFANPRRQVFSRRGPFEPAHNKINNLTGLAKTQIGLDKGLVGQEFSRKLRPLATQLEHSRYSDQPGQMPRLIRVLGGTKSNVLYWSTSQ